MPNNGAFLRLVGGLVSSMRKKKQPEFAGGEAEEASRLYALSPDEYNELRSKLLLRFKETYADEIRDKVRKEVATTIRADLEKEHRDRIAKETPTPKTREAVSAFARELELEALAAAEAASSAATEGEAKTKRVTSTRRPLGLVILSLLAPLSYFLFEKFGLSYGFFAFLIPFVFASMFFIVRPIFGRAAANAVIAKQLELVSSYRYLAENLRQFWMIEVPSESSQDSMIRRVDHFLERKQSLDSQFQPNLEAVKKARIRVRDQLSEEMDLEKVISEPVRIATPQPEKPLSMTDEGDPLDPMMYTRERGDP